MLLLGHFQDESANAGSKVVASLFLSPGGPKFTSLMLNLANHVMLQEMKTFRTGVCSTLCATPAPPMGPDGLGWGFLLLFVNFFWFFRRQLGPRGRGHSRLLAGYGSQAFGADQQKVPENSGGAGSIPPRVPEESPVSPGRVLSLWQCGSGRQAKFDYKGENWQTVAVECKRVE